MDCILPRYPLFPILFILIILTATFVIASHCLVPVALVSTRRVAMIIDDRNDKNVFPPRSSSRPRFINLLTSLIPIRLMEKKWKRESEGRGQNKINFSWNMTFALLSLCMNSMDVCIVLCFRKTKAKPILNVYIDDRETSQNPEFGISLWHVYDKNCFLICFDFFHRGVKPKTRSS